MCGISGIWDPSRPEDILSVLRRATETLSHRGPDDVGFWLDSTSGLALGHRRLSIIDLSELGHQPMTGAGGNTWLTFNGEIYNHLELRRDMESDGVSFRSASDTEVILALYERHGMGFVGFLRGMFAFALWDAEQRHLILARDRLGKKPLYYCSTGGALYFGSEIKAIVSALPTPPSIDYKALDEYLSFGFVGGDRTVYVGIRQILPGMMLVARGPSEMRSISYWRPRWEPKRNLTLAEAVDQAEALLTEAIRLRIRADVPIGVFLSGGIDSGLVVAITSRLMGGCLTLSVGFDEENFDERPLAKQVAQQYDTEHHGCVLQPDVVSLIPRMAWHYDQPFADASAIASFALAAYARQHVKVVLNGDGGDEVFGGYRRHVASRIAAQLCKRVPRDLVRQCSRLLIRALPRPRSFRTAYTFTHRFLHVLAGSPSESIVALYSGGLTDAEKRALYKVPPESDGACGVIAALMESVDSLDDVDRALAIDLVWELPGDLLVKMDIATMAYGLEARSPLLDHEVVSWANTLPGSLRLGGLSTKPILRKLATRYLPHSVVRAPKRGFEVPISKWLIGDLAEMRDDLILSRNGIVCSLFERFRLEHILRKSSSVSGHWGQTVWNLLMLAAWERYSYKDIVGSLGKERSEIRRYTGPNGE